MGIGKTEENPRRKGRFIVEIVMTGKYGETG